MELFAPGAVLAGRYRVLRELGRGGMGVVYLVEHVHTGQEHALKVLSLGAGLSAEAIERFKREARAPARIKSEHVVTVTDADVLPELGGAPFFVMERLVGRDLDAELAAHGKVSQREVVSLLGQAARALDRSHDLGIVHRDLKPENLFLHRREDGSLVLKILDFGISKMVEGEAGHRPASLTGPGSLVGTPLYMSPEQATDGAPVTRATDVWSMGLVAVRLLTGEYYWRSTSIGELMVALLRDPMLPPSSRWPALPPAFDAWFSRSCDRDPARRFASVGAQIEELARALGEPAPARLGRAVISVHPQAEAAELGVTVGAAAAAAGEVDATLRDSTKQSLTLTPAPVAAPRRGRAAALALGVGLALALGVGAGASRRWARAPAAGVGLAPAAADAPSGAAASEAASAPEASGAAAAAGAPAAGAGAGAGGSGGSVDGARVDGASPPLAAPAPPLASGSAAARAPQPRPRAPAADPRRAPPPPSPTHDPVAP